MKYCRKRAAAAPRSSLHHRLTLVATVLLSLVGIAPAHAESSDRPNLVLIMADDLGWSDIGCYGGEIGTPHIDSLAADGLRFKQFYNNSVCGPTRASLLTGLYCQQTGHRGDRWNEPMDFSRCATVAELLQRSGYRTLMVGKWQGRESALVRGFDRFFGPMCQAKISYFHEVDQNPFYLDDQRWELPSDFYLTDSFNAYAAEFLEEAVEADEPFFLYVAHIAPHWPLHARPAETARYRERYRQLGWDQLRVDRLERQRDLGVVDASGKLSPRPAVIRDWDAAANKDWQAERMAVYAAQVAAIDHGVGQLLNLIDTAGKRENTVVMFLSDNGAAPDGGLEPTKSGFGFVPGGKNDGWRKDGVAIRPGSGPENMPGAHDTFAAYGLAWATASNTPLRGTKLTAYEGGIRTPLVVRWPAVIPNQGGVTDHVGHVIDLMPTLLEAAGAEYPSKLDDRELLPHKGHSLVPVFRGEAARQHQALFWSVPRHQAVRAGRWKAIREKATRTKPVGAWQLFDLQDDASETTDLAQREPERVTELSTLFDIWQKKVGAQ